MATQVILSYTVSSVVVTPAQLAVKMAAVPLPTGGPGAQANPFSEVGVSFISDITIPIVGGAARRIQFSLLPIFTPFNIVPPPQVAADGTGARYNPSIVSSDPRDTVLGLGAQRTILHYESPDIVAGINSLSADAVLNGTTPSNFIATNVGVRTASPTLQTTFGAGGSNAGLVSVYSGQNATGIILQELPANFQGSIFSTDQNDLFGFGDGAQQIQITYTDVGGGGPFVELVNLLGTNPVNLTNFNHRTITGMVPTLSGTVTSNLGTISLMSGRDGTGGVKGRLLPSFFSYFRPNPADIAGKADERIRAPFKSLFTHILANGLSSKVVELPIVVI